MKFFDSTQIKEIDNKSIEYLNISSHELMENAALAFVSRLKKQINHSSSIKIFCGPGNNGGDGLAIARLLRKNDYKLDVYIIESSQQRTSDNLKNLNLLEGLVKIYRIAQKDDFPVITYEDIIIDAIFGAGLNRPLSGIYLELIQYLNSTNSWKIAVDIPSGLAGEIVFDQKLAILADQTFSFQFPFLSFFYEESAKFIGKWEILDIGIPVPVIRSIETQLYYTDVHTIKIKKRPDFGHKGTFGHALLLAGSKGMAGAAILSAKACLKSGCGLVTAHLPGSVSGIMQISFPEAICSSDTNDNFITQLPSLLKYSAVGAGPGLGQHSETANIIEKLIIDSKVPIILDADAINLIAAKKELLNKLPENTILTPHPGEFKRLFGESANSYERIKLLKSQSAKLKTVIVLKGRYTCVALPSGDLYFNSSGNNGMGTAGSGDVLTGIILSLLAQSYSSEEAAIFGVYIHGFAGDCALKHLEPESIVASDIISYISSAFREIKMNL